MFLRLVYTALKKVASALLAVVPYDGDGDGAGYDHGTFYFAGEVSYVPIESHGIKVGAAGRQHVRTQHTAGLCIV